MCYFTKEISWQSCQYSPFILLINRCTAINKPSACPRKLIQFKLFLEKPEGFAVRYNICFVLVVLCRRDDACGLLRVRRWPLLLRETGHHGPCRPRPSLRRHPAPYPGWHGWRHEAPGPPKDRMFSYLVIFLFSPAPFYLIGHATCDDCVQSLCTPSYIHVERMDFEPFVSVYARSRKFIIFTVDFFWTQFKAPWLRMIFTAGRRPQGLNEQNLALSCLDIQAYLSIFISRT